MHILVSNSASDQRIQNSSYKLMHARACLYFFGSWHESAQYILQDSCGHMPLHVQGPFPASFLC